MSIRITYTSMASDRTVHYAELLDGEADIGSWQVSWLPGRIVTRNEAITAMVLAETVTVLVDRDELTHDHPSWPHIDNWAGELDLTGPDAVVRVSEQASVVRERLRAELAVAGGTLRRIEAGAS